MKDRNIEHKDDWETPDYILEDVRSILGDNYFDPCPLGHDTKKWDGLKVDWERNNYCNPPYSRKLKEAFIKKAKEEQVKGNTTLMLLPVSTSTKIFHEEIYHQAEITFIKGRIKFIGVNTKGEKVSNKCGMHDSMFVKFKGVPLFPKHPKVYECDEELKEQSDGDEWFVSYANDTKMKTFSLLSRAEEFANEVEE